MAKVSAVVPSPMNSSAGHGSPAKLAHNCAVLSTCTRRGKFVEGTVENVRRDNEMYTGGRRMITQTQTMTSGSSYLLGKDICDRGSSEGPDGCRINRHHVSSMQSGQSAHMCERGRDRGLVLGARKWLMLPESH